MKPLAILLLTAVISSAEPVALQNGGNLRSGNNRVGFSPYGKTLYVGQTVRGWGKPAEGLQPITYQGGTSFDIATINKDGFRLTFTEDAPGIIPSISQWQGVYPEKVYMINMRDLKSHHGAMIRNRKFAHTVHRIPGDPL